DRGAQRLSAHRLGYFGRIAPVKGLTVLLEAMKLLDVPAAGSPAPHLWVHGSGVDRLPSAYRKDIDRLLAAAGNVTFAGSYHHSEIGSLMRELDWVVVPSTWWENSPLVIQEAFHHRRPVVCSDIGGMAEKVEDDVNGLHFTA